MGLLNGGARGISHTQNQKSDAPAASATGPRRPTKMTPLDAPATVPPLDPNALDALRSLNPGDDSFLRDLIQIFLEDSPARIAEIAEALAEVRAELGEDCEVF